MGRHITTLTPSSAEGESVMYGVWISILTWQFDPRDGYITCPHHSLQFSSRGFSDFQVHQYISLVVQCKGEFGGYIWDGARDQLEKYLQPIHGDPESSPTVHGIVAIGQ
ncbi:uncharacterized protein N7518_008999 [Penicillium psychrosexuale]|uniref:uncharacterized protein n=1 Tax=Penicillium psychrosexuale TaxID=1002107 RepID=UPI002544DCF5|nr:uncharacterized protein N7518_008999 [Penicillium psychrosexuale]KAJ5783322.1 hypothetical protein N7518_008999 [Penicillium psychrosexuale]